MADDSTHISGLGQTAIDVTGIVQKMVDLKALPEKTWIVEQEEIAKDVGAWSDITSLMTDLTGSLDTLRSYELWNKMEATASDSTSLSASAGSSAVTGKYDIAISRLAQSHSVRSTDFTSATADLSSGGGTGSLTDGDTFEIGGVNFTVGADEYGQTLVGKESLTTLAGKINNASSAMTAAGRVVATVISANPTAHYLVLTRVKTGDTCIDSADTLGTSLQSLQIRSTAGPGDAYPNVLAAHQDAAFTINTIPVTRSSNTGLTDVISGITLNLLSETTTDVTLTVAADKASAKAAILAFVEKYNAAAAKIKEYGQISTQGSALDPKGASVSSKGELYNDSLLADIARNLRQQVTDTKFPALNSINASYTYDGRTGIMSSLQAIGIWTSGEDNKLTVLDENRLESVLQSNFGEVEQLFRGVFDATNGYQDGIGSDFYRYTNAVTAPMTGAIANRVDTLNNKGTSLQTKIDDMDAYLKVYEQDLWIRFTAMDDAISKLQSSLAGLKNITG